MMKNIKLGIMLFAVTAFGLACSGSISVGENKTTEPAKAANTAINTASTPAASVDELAGAKKVWTETCSKCHKPDGKGGETDLDGKKIKVPDLTSDRSKEASDDELRDFIENGEDGKMPAFKDKLKADEITALVKFIRKDIQKK